jgi:hypothetical protein
MTRSPTRNNRSGNGQPLHPSQGFGKFFPESDGQRAAPRADGSKRRAGARSGNEVNYGAAGLAAAAGLEASAGLAAIAGLLASAGAAADAAASGAGAVSSDLLQAVAKNIVTSARSRTLRIAFSLVARGSIERGNLKRGKNTIGAA